MRRFSSVPSSLGMYENGTGMAELVGGDFTRGESEDEEGSWRWISAILCAQ